MTDRQAGLMRHHAMQTVVSPEEEEEEEERPRSFRWNVPDNSRQIIQRILLRLPSFPASSPILC